MNKIKKIYNNSENLIVVIVEPTKEEKKDLSRIYLPTGTYIEKCVVLYDNKTNRNYLSGDAPVKWVYNTLLLDLSTSDSILLNNILLDSYLDVKNELHRYKLIEAKKEESIVHIDEGKPAVDNPVIKTFIEQGKDETIKNELLSEIPKIIKLYRKGKINNIINNFGHYINYKLHFLFGITTNKKISRPKKITQDETTIIFTLLKEKIPVRQIAIFIDRTYDQVFYIVRKNKKRLN